MPAQNGLAVKTAALTAALNGALEHPGHRRQIKVRTTVTAPKVQTSKLAGQYPSFITVDRGNFTLRVYKDLKLARSYSIAVGQQGLETPAGLYHIQNKAVNPSWQVPNSPWAGSLAGKLIPPGPDDPIKARWMGIFDGAGIHGTDEVSSIGHAFSHGCVRMLIPDVIDLYDRVRSARRSTSATDAAAQPPRYARLRSSLLSRSAGRALEHDLAGRQHVAAVGDRQRHVRVLLDHQHCDTRLVDLLDDPEVLLHERGRETHRRFVHQQHARL